MLPIPTDVFVGERRFCKVIAAATARFIPARRIVEIRPNFPAEPAVSAKERDTLRYMSIPVIPEDGISIWRFGNW